MDPTIPVFNISLLIVRAGTTLLVVELLACKDNEVCRRENSADAIRIPARERFEAQNVNGVIHVTRSARARVSHSSRRTLPPNGLWIPRFFGQNREVG